VSDRVGFLARLLADQMLRITQLEIDLADAKKAARQTAEVDLPDVLREMGISSIALEDGTKVDLVTDYFASISEANKPAAFDWLRDHNLSGVIKTSVGAQFDRGAVDEAMEFAQAAGDLLGRDMTVDESVHASTLKALVREQIESGVDMPFELFGIREVRKAKVKFSN